MNAGAGNVLPVAWLDGAAFAPFGEVIEAAAAARTYPINGGTAMRHHDLAGIDTGSEGGRSVLAIVQAAPRTLPLAISMLERHPLGSQAWIPLSPTQRFLVVVAEDPAVPPRAFLARGGQGVNYRRGTWHHPLLALDAPGAYLVIDRDGPGANCDEVALDRPWRIDALPVQFPGATSKLDAT